MNYYSTLLTSVQIGRKGYQSDQKEAEGGMDWQQIIKYTDIQKKLLMRFQ